MAHHSDPVVRDHLEWLGFVKPTGLVVSALALARSGAVLNRRDAEGQQRLVDCLDAASADEVRETAPAYGAATAPRIRSFAEFAKTFLGWSFTPQFYAGTPEAAVPGELMVALEGEDDALRPTYAVRDRSPKDGAPSWQLLVQEVDGGGGFDDVPKGTHREASPHVRFERLLREAGVPAGVLAAPHALRLVSAPRGESSGWLDFKVGDMVQPAGQPIAAALRLLLGEPRLLTGEPRQRLLGLLEESRKYQNEVSVALAAQVLHALYELLRGLQAAQAAGTGQAIRDAVREAPQGVYRALLTVILRLVFLLYAEERDLLPRSEAFTLYYSLTGLHQRLREDAALHPDTMDQRYGAWAQLLVLFRLVHDGARAGDLRLPQRHGALFDPDAYPFLEGRPAVGARQVDHRIDAPRISDGAIHRALEKLLVLEGERLSYRALDVEQIGSVYETMMGFRLERATGPSLAIRPMKRHGAPTSIDLEALLKKTGRDRAKHVLELTGRKVSMTVGTPLVAARTLDDLHAALAPIVDRAASPDIVPKDALVLQPSEERRRSGSHYTPRALTEPIVRRTLAPILDRLRQDDRSPTPDAILDLKVCDPAMGSGAFLIEACRQLGDALVEAWRVWGSRPQVPPDEDELTFARRVVAQRCLYGVDRNPIAVDLAKVSLWLATLARDHALTFIDHALRHGDSLVGLSREQLEAFDWDRTKVKTAAFEIRDEVARVVDLRRQIREAADDTPDDELRQWWRQAEDELSSVRLTGDLAVAAFFDAAKPKDRQRRRTELQSVVANRQAESLRGWIDDLRRAEPPLAPFHWQLEFPEVFDRANPGFDAFVGNPPFMGGAKLSASQGRVYLAFLGATYSRSHGKSDLVAYFLRRAFDLARGEGGLGFLTTNSIAEGPTRVTGLAYVRKEGGRIYFAQRRICWPGEASVVVSALSIAKGRVHPRPALDGKVVDVITAYLLPYGPDDNPFVLQANREIAHSGVNPNGRGFIVDLAERNRLVAQDPTASARVRPYLSSIDMNESPQCAPARFIIDLSDCSQEEARRYSKLYEHLHATVRLQRQRSTERRLREQWWQFSRPAASLRRASHGLNRVLAMGRVATFHTLSFQSADVVFSDAITVFAREDWGAFTLLQSYAHEAWAAIMGSSFKDDPRYIPEECFETFPLPLRWPEDLGLQHAGKEYYEHRSAVMLTNVQGLTETYNRFNSPDERDPTIAALRRLHCEMDCSVLRAYGWTDIRPTSDFFREYETDDDNHEDDMPRTRSRRGEYRYRWPDATRDEVLARLLDLNAARARDASAGPAKEPSGKSKSGKSRTPKGGADADLFS